jgi:formate dehydrogenase subunit delta
MHTEQLVTMANDIASFFHGAVDPNEAARNVATHLRLYWDPRMRKQLLEHLRSGGAGLGDLARNGAELLMRE